MYCQNCGQELPESARFCDRCGMRIGGGFEPPRTGPDECDIASIMVNKKSEGLAIILSVIIPGLGQMYVGDLKRGAVIFVSIIVVTFLWMLCLADLGYSASMFMLVASLVLMVLTVAMWFYSIYDAYRLAKEHNQELLRRGGRMY